MIISRTPYRISFFGGGTDYPDWYLKNGGEVLSASIDKYCYLSCRYLPPFFPHRIRIMYSKNELCQDIDEIQHPSVRGLLKYLQADVDGLEIFHQGDLPARSGIGSSSSFTVGLLNAMYALKGKMIGKEQLAKECIHIEQDVIKETVGSQDQISAAYGGVNHIKFFSSGSFSVNPIVVDLDRIAELNQHLMLFFTGVVRTADKIAKSYAVEIEKKRKHLSLMGKMVGEAIAIMNNAGTIDDFGKLLHEACTEKKELSQIVSNSYVNEIYSVARETGALGGKLCGAGGGGFMLLFVPPEKQPAIKEKLSKLVYVPFNFEYGGSQIMYSDKQKRYLEEENVRNNKSITSHLDLTNL